MVIVEKKVFLHIAKCGGTYFRRLLAENGVKEAFLYWKPPTEKEDDLGHLNLNNFHIHLKPGSYQLHTMMRHPWDRFISGWQYVQRRFASKPVEQLRTAEDEILSHCGSPMELIDFLLENPRCLYERTCPWLHPQFLYIDDRVEVYEYESSEDWGVMLEAFGVSANLLKNLNIKRHPSDPNSKLYKKVMKVYAQDFALYDKRGSIATNQ